MNITFTLILIGLSFGLGQAVLAIIKGCGLNLIGVILVVSFTLHVYIGLGFLLWAMWTEKW